MVDGRFSHLRDLEILASLLRREALTAGKFNDALVCASLLGRLHWDNISGLFGDDELETRLFDRWKSELPVLSSRTTSGSKPRKWVFVLSRASAAGGHSRLMKQLSSGLARYDIEQSFVVTHRATFGVLNSFPDRLQNGVVLKGPLENRLRSLYTTLLNADVILLLNNPDDIGAALAARALRKMNKCVLFVNHADHVFSFGPGAADTVLEICATGWNTTAERRLPNSQSFMGIPLVEADSETVPIRCNTSGPILSIGGPGKYKPTANLNFASFLERILSLVPNDVVLIGPSKKEDWWADLSRKYSGRVHLMGIQPPETVNSEFKRASCYIDSFPMDGGTVFSEAIMNGLPAFGLNRKAALGISPADALRCDGVDQLVVNISHYLNTGERPAGLDIVQNQIREEFSNKAVADRLFEAASGTYAPLPDFLVAMGNRSPDYNAEHWRENGNLYCPKRSWRKLSIGMKIRMLRSIGKLGLSHSIVKELRYRLIFG
ncbi:hypothetical protein SAMN05421666_0711 [Roseovarius nanhaiticus]|uniref:Glycosyl transferases group 1 n=1 Tax=Roseovarius nanhaiticus TaxID=573024 RepID=A0A1N7F364_9RHOB|nr:hypothetical protein [Roseovarius nanhaiticus]SEK62577.1 hypothetical protein SAMN05216208_1424 [Roseovarius nanhaiticus]SIR94724.1 hypothetical protein SAMN05421666_0711 [Roseovarius nanhaiticus]